MFLDNFFHRRVTDPASFRLCGYIRMAHAFLIICDRLLLTVDFRWFFLSGMIPYDANSKDFYPSQFTFFSMIPPDSSAWYWGLHITCIVQAVLLFLGVFPKFQLAGIHLIMLSFYHHNDRLWDGEDEMFRMWDLMLFFLPLNHVTIFDRFKGPTESSTKSSLSWPMWPVRLWQVEVSFIYFGASFGKLQNPRWLYGHALQHVIHTNDFFGGIFAPDFMFNRVGPLRLLTYTSLMLETISPVSAWIAPRTTAILMILLHLGIEMAMNMHCFEWLSMIGWSIFLIQGNKEAPIQGSRISRMTITSAVMFFLGIVAYQTTPLEQIFFLVPESWQQGVGRLIMFRNEHPVPLLHILGWSQHDWDMYSGAPSESFYHEAFDATGKTIWSSPRWEGLKWYEQKRWQRPMTFYDGLEDAGEEAKAAFAWYLVEKYNVTTSLQIVKHISEPNDSFWNNYGNFSFWDKAKHTVSRTETREVYLLNVCADWHELCQERASQNGCLDQGFPWMRYHCRKTCNFCSRIEDIVEGSNLIIYRDLVNMFVDATVHDIRKNKYLLDYGPSYSHEDRFEWVDVATLRVRNYVLLRTTE